MGRLDRAETYTHIIRPAVGEVSDKEVITKFWHGCRKGNWGDGMELATECRRIMAAHDVAALTPAVLDAALAWSGQPACSGVQTHERHAKKHLWNRGGSVGTAEKS